MSAPLRLHVGCGPTSVAGFVNADLYPTATTDLCFDLLQPWPFVDGSAEVIYASHVLEHLRDPFSFFREAWRVCMPQGTVLLRVPYGGHPSAWHDPTHVRPWYAESFACVQPGYGAAVRNPQYTAGGMTFAVQVDMRLNTRVARWLRRWPWRQRLVHALMSLWPQVCEELYVRLIALKSPEACQAFATVGNAIAVHYMVARTDADGDHVLVPL